MSTHINNPADAESLGGSFAPISADDDAPFTYDDAANLLKGSISAHVGSYGVFVVAVITLIVNLDLIDVEANNNNATATAGPCSTDTDLRLSSEKFYAATAFTFATGQVIPLAKATR